MTHDFPSQAGSTSPELIARVQQDDQDAWRILVKTYSPLVYYWCRRQAQLPANDAADVMQDVFFAVARTMPRFSRTEGGSFRGWLRAITTSKLGDHFRRAARGPAAEGGSHVVQRMHALPADKPPDSQPSSSPNGSEQAVVLHAALEQIRGRFAPQCWQAFWRSQIEGRPRADVAVELEMTVAAVNQAAYRVRRRLKEVLQDRSELPGCR